MATWGTPEEVERRRRIRVAVWAYAYEKLNESLVSDDEFDRECKLVDLSISTGNKRMDRWFRSNFDPCTGQWVNTHPDQRGLHAACQRILARTRRFHIIGEPNGPRQHYLDRG